MCPEAGPSARLQCRGGPVLVLWCFVLNPHQPHARLKTRRRRERNTNELCARGLLPRGTPLFSRPLNPTPELRPLTHHLQAGARAELQPRRGHAREGERQVRQPPLGGAGPHHPSAVIRKEAWPFYRTSSGSRLSWVSKNLKDLTDLNARNSDPWVHPTHLHGLERPLSPLGSSSSQHRRTPETVL